MHAAANKYLIADNRTIGFPYPKYMNAIMEVDQAAAVLNWATRVMELPIGVFAAAIATVVFPLIARHAARAKPASRQSRPITTQQKRRQKMKIQWMSKRP